MEDPSGPLIRLLVFFWFHHFLLVFFLFSLFLFLKVIDAFFSRLQACLAWYRCCWVSSFHF